MRKSHKCIILLLSLLLANIVVIAQVPTNGLIGYWPFNGNANDMSGNGNHGILECESNLPQLTTDRFGNPNSAYQFGGYYNKNWIRVPNNSTMHLNSQMTISFWYQQCEFSGMDGWGSYSTTNANFSLVTKAGDGIAAYPGVFINNGINSQTGNVNINSANCNGNASYNMNYTINIEYHCFDTCEWMHFVTVIDDNVAKIYVNGVLYHDTIVNHANFTQANVQDLYFGRMGCNGTIWYPFHGKLDDVAFYNRALTNDEVAQLFSNYYDPHFFDNQIIIENLIVQEACNGNDGSVQVFVNPENGPFQYALDQPTNFQNSNLLDNINVGLHRVYVKSECGLKDTIVDVSCLDIPLPDNIDSADCTVASIGHDWGIEMDWSSSEFISPLVIPLVGDVDGDGVPEIICFAPDNNYNFYGVTEVKVFNTMTHSVIHTINLPSAVSTVEGAPYGIIKLHNGHVAFVVVMMDYSMQAYDLTAMSTSPLWTVATDYEAPNVGFADFNGDSYPELYIGNKIYDVETGALLISDASINNQGASFAHSGVLVSSFATDIVGDAKTDLILGNEIYDVVITNRNGLAGNSITLSNSITPPQDIGTDGHAQVADFNLDGHLDVFISKKNSDYEDVAIYVWDVFNNTVSTPTIISTSGGGKSIPLIADIDNDDLLEIIIQCRTSSGGKVKAYKYNIASNSFSEMWDYEVDEDSFSNSMTAFDFNNNGNMELLLSDQSTIKILNGSGHSHVTDNDTIPVYTLTSLSFGECTVMQYPVIADVDADGSAEIVAVGLFGSGHTYQAYLNVFSSSGLPWAPARKVWNQYMYNVTNVNQDLTIPQQLFNNATPFTDPDGVVRRPFNNFLQQATTIDRYGRPFYAVPDAAALSADVIPSGSNSTLNITYTNQGDNTLNAPYYITVFANELGGAMMQSLTVDAPLAVGNTVQQSLVFSTYDLCQMPDLNSLVVVINCAGGGIAQNGNLQPECDIENNITQVSVNLQNEPINITETACNQFVWHGETYTQSGQYEVTISNPYGCDTTFILNLTISDNYREEDRVSECNSYYWPRTQQWYYQSALDSVVIQSQQGVCDSTFVLDLTLHYSDTLNLEPVTVCEAFEWHGQTYAESGTYTYDTVNQYGCQTQYVLPLTISHSVEHEFSVTSCEPYEWYGTVYDESGTYTQVLTGSQGCDSIVTLNLMVALSSEGSIHGPTTIYASTDLVPGVYSYYIDSTGIDLSNVRWGIDREDWQLIPHGGSCDLLCMSDGQGILHVWTEGEFCNMDTTIVVNATFFGMGEEEASLRVYPNPTKEKLTVEWEEIQVINVYDLLGQKLMSSEYGKAQSCVLDLSHFRHSMYVLEIVSSTGRVIRPVVLTQ